MPPPVDSILRRLDDVEATLARVEGASSELKAESAKLREWVDAKGYPILEFVDKVRNLGGRTDGLEKHGI